MAQPSPRWLGCFASNQKLQPVDDDSRDRELPGGNQKPSLPRLGRIGLSLHNAGSGTAVLAGWPIANLVMNMGIQAVGTDDVPSWQPSASRRVQVPVRGTGAVWARYARRLATGRAGKLRTALRVVNENAKKGRVDSELGPSFDEGHGTSSFRGTCCPFLYARRPRPTSASSPASSPQKQPPREPGHLGYALVLKRHGNLPSAFPPFMPNSLRLEIGNAPCTAFLPRLPACSRPSRAQRQVPPSIVTIIMTIPSILVSRGETPCQLQEPALER